MTDVTILDGGMGRELKRSGAPFRQPEWSALALIEAPETVSRAHRRFIDAGAEIITTNNYAVVPFHLGEDRFRGRGVELTALAGELARAAASAGDRDIRVAGSVPPLFGSYRPDLFDDAEARRILPPLIDALEPFVDIFLAETMSSLAEASAAVWAIESRSPPFWLSFTLSDETEGRLRSGELVADAADLAMASGAQAVLFNCSQPEMMAPALLIAANQAAKRPEGIILGAYANAFPPISAGHQANAAENRLRDDLTAEGYLGFAESWVDAGARLIGGCCGIGPEHISALSHRFKAKGATV